MKLSEPDETISGIASAMGNLANAPRAVEQMRVAAWNFARQQTWDRRAAQMTKIYLNLVNTGGKVSPVLQFDN
ncbi:MAG: hypothetical protein JO061_18350 [Acidobacteriaceae bacterium]|nr:hypothetical protein [Acidobacteriaceae bacterium]